MLSCCRYCLLLLGYRLFSLLCLIPQSSFLLLVLLLLVAGFYTFYASSSHRLLLLMLPLSLIENIENVLYLHSFPAFFRSPCTHKLVASD